MTDTTKPRSVFFEKDGDKIVIWTNHNRWTVTDMVAGGTKRYTKQLAIPHHPTNHQLEVL